jgi:hypothetical protein
MVLFYGVARLPTSSNKTVTARDFLKGFIERSINASEQRQGLSGRNACQLVYNIGVF